MSNVTISLGNGAFEATTSIVEGHVYMNFKLDSKGAPSGASLTYQVEPDNLQHTADMLRLMATFINEIGLS